MVSQAVVDGAQFVEGLRVVVPQFGRGLQVADGLAHLPQLDEALRSQLPSVDVPHACLDTRRSTHGFLVQLTCQI